MNKPIIVFQRADAYLRLFWRKPLSVREQPAPDYGEHCTERHLQCVWYDGALRPSVLRTSAGEEVAVLSPGRWNLEAGPDFLEATLRIGAEQRHVTGDIEVHQRPADWDSHNHATDPRYSRVVAHVTYFGGSLPSGALPPGAVQIALKDALSANPYFSFESVDTAAYPYAERVPQTPCAKLLAAKPVDFIVSIIESAGEERLRRKAERIAAAVKERGKDQVFYEEIMCALGYKNNRVAFRQLARRLPFATLRDESGLDPNKGYALLLGVSGLTPAGVSPRWDDDTRSYVRSLWDIWWKQRESFASLVMPRSAWSLAGLRPQNHPARRLAAAASLFCAARPILEEIVAVDSDEPARWIADMTRILQNCAGSDFWAHRLSLGRPRAADTLALIGESRAASVLCNVVVPFLAATWIVPARYAEVLSLLPAEQENSIVRRTAFILLGPDHNPKFYHSALRQQGLLQIFHDACLNDRSGCQSCPLPSALT